MDRLYICLIPFLYFLRMTITILSVAMSLVPNPSNIERALVNGAKWTVIFFLHPNLFALSGLHSLVQIPIFQNVLNLVLQFSLVRICLYWPRFYFSILRSKENQCSIWVIITKPVPPDGHNASKPSNKITFLNQNICCFSYYQVRGAHTHLNQSWEKDLDKAAAAATTLVYYENPLYLEISYMSFLELFPEPPDGMLNSILPFTLIIFVYLFPIFLGLISFWLKRIGVYIILIYNKNIFVNHARRRRKQHNQLPALHVNNFATDASGGRAFSWDTDRIPFVINNSVTAITSNECRIFTGQFKTVIVTLETTKGLTTTTKSVGTLRLVLTDNIIEQHI